MDIEHKCARCGEAFKRKDTLITHLKRINECKPTVSNVTRTSIIDELTKKEYNDKTYDCEFCKKKFNQSSTKSRHKNICKKNPTNIKTEEAIQEEVENLEEINSIVNTEENDFESIKQLLAKLANEVFTIKQMLKHGLTRKIKGEIEEYLQSTPLLNTEIIESAENEEVSEPLQVTTKSTNKKKKKQKIPLNLRKATWNTYIGIDIGRSKCKCCNLFDVTQHDFHCGHIVAESNGGQLHLDNLRPICDKCNYDMGSQDMKVFAKKFYSVDIV